MNCEVRGPDATRNASIVHNPLRNFMKQKLHVLAAAVALVGLMGANTAHAAGFTNGSFETGDTTGWTFSADAFGLNPFGTTYGVGMDGLYWAWMAGFELPRFMEQTLTGLTAGAAYSVNFIMASESIRTDHVILTADGLGAQTFTAPPDTGGFWNNWVSKSYGFTATGSSATIRFSTFGLDPTAQYDVGIDKVELTGAVPEPETYALMLAGLGALGWVARRRRN